LCIHAALHLFYCLWFNFKFKSLSLNLN